MNDFTSLITAGGEKKPYGMILSDELNEAFAGLPAVKCTDSVFLLVKNSGVFLYDENAPEPGLVDPGALPESADLSGFTTELSFAPDCILPAKFDTEALTIGKTRFPVSVHKAAEKLYAVLSKSGSFLILLDASRFLLYAFAENKFLCGYLEV